VQARFRQPGGPADRGGAVDSGNHTCMLSKRPSAPGSPTDKLTS
jgi:hypothetical protein